MESLFNTSNPEDVKATNTLQLFDFKKPKDLLRASIVGLGVWALKEYIPPLIKEFKESLHKTILISSEDTNDLYEKAEVWLQTQEKLYCSKYTVKQIAKNNKVQLTVGYAPALYKVKGKICIIERQSQEFKNTYSKEHSLLIKLLYTKDIQIAQEILEDIKAIDIKKENENRIKIIYGYNDFYKNKRDLNTIAMKQEDKDFIVEDIQKFLENSKWYAQRGITYKRNYMLYGEAGCGKSSLIWALASHFNKDLKIADISDLSSASDLRYLLSRSKNTFIVFEDIDAMNISTTSRDKCETVEGTNAEQSLTPAQPSKISLSSLLNTFDGIGTPDGSVCFFTTNYLDRLDKAFIRDGRMDIKLEIGKIGKTEIIENIAKNFLSEEEVQILYKELVSNIQIVPAKVQTILMDNNIGEAIYKLNYYANIERLQR